MTTKVCWGVPIKYYKPAGSTAKEHKQILIDLIYEKLKDISWDTVETEETEEADFFTPKLNKIESFMDFDRVSFFHVEDESIFESMQKNKKV